MKYLILISIVILTAGFLLKETYFTINIHDTYYVTSYFYIAVLLAVLLNLTFVLKIMLKKLLRK